MSDAPDDAPWMDKETFMREQSRSERTVQQWVTQGKAERQIIDGKAYYRLSPQHPATVQHPPAPQDAPEWAQELLQEIRALRAAIEQQGVSTREIGASAEGDDTPQQGSTPIAPAPQDERSTAAPRSAPWWKRLFGLE